jgi:hypothetical protein
MNKTQQAILKWLANAETGISSETLAFWAGFDVKKEHRRHPLDPSDFNRCLTLLRAVPALREDLHKMSVLSPQWARVVANWDQIEKVFIAEVGPDWRKNPRIVAKKTYDLMQMVIEGKTPSQSTPSIASITIRQST